MGAYAMTDYLLIAFAILQILDGYTTYTAVTGGKGKEANGLLAFLFKKVGLIPVMLVKGAALVYVASLVDQPSLIGMCAIYVFIVANNFRVIYGR